MSAQAAVTPFAAAGQPETLQTLLRQDAYKKRFEQVLGQRAPQFISSILSLGATMRDVEPRSVLAAAAVAASLDLPIERSFGFAHIVPYKKAGRKYGSFQMGYKGIIQLAQRTGAYERMNAEAINAEAYKGRDKVGEPIIDWDAVDSSKPVAGYAFAFQLINGFIKVAYWSKEKVEAHAKQYSQAYRAGYETPWKTHFDAMALKTVIRNTLPKWGIMSVELQGAFAEENVIRKDIDAPPEFPDDGDGIGKPVFDGETGQPITEPSDAAAEAAAGLAPAPAPSMANVPAQGAAIAAPATPAEDKAAAAKAQEALARTRGRKAKEPEPPPQATGSHAPKPVTAPVPPTPAPAPAQPPPPAPAETPAPTEPEPSVAEALAGPEPEPEPEPQGQPEQQGLQLSPSYAKLMGLLQIAKITEDEVLSICHRRGLATAAQVELVQLSDKKLDDLSDNIAQLSAQVRIDRKSRGPKT